MQNQLSRTSNGRSGWIWIAAFEPLVFAGGYSSSTSCSATVTCLAAPMTVFRYSDGSPAESSPGGSVNRARQPDRLFVLSSSGLFDKFSGLSSNMLERMASRLHFVRALISSAAEQTGRVDKPLPLPASSPTGPPRTASAIARPSLSYRLDSNAPRPRPLPALFTTVSRTHDHSCPRCQARSSSGRTRPRASMKLSSLVSQSLRAPFRASHLGAVS